MTPKLLRHGELVALAQLLEDQFVCLARQATSSSTSSLSERTYQPLAWTLRRPAHQYILTQYPRWNSASNRLRGGFVTDRPQRNVAGRVSYLLAD
jgi:hypothetical protein